MKSSEKMRRDAKALIRSCLIDGLLDENRTQQVVQKAAESKRRGSMALLAQFERLVRLQTGKQRAEVESAVPLPADLRSRVETDLRRLYGPGVKVRFTECPGLIGGVRVVVGSDVYDGSIKNRLTELGKAFSAGVGGTGG